MTIRFYPKGLLVTAVFLAVFGTTLAVAEDVERGVAVAGLLSVLAYIVIELFIGL